MMIHPEPIALKHDPEKCEAVFRKDRAQTVTSSAMMIHPEPIALEHDPEKCEAVFRKDRAQAKLKRDAQTKNPAEAPAGF